MRRTNARVEQYRQRVVEKWKASGLTQAEFCRREGISDWKLSEWKRRQVRSGDAKNRAKRVGSDGAESRPTRQLKKGLKVTSEYKQDAPTFIPIVPGSMVGRGSDESDAQIVAQIYFSRPGIQVILSGLDAITLQSLLVALVESGP